MRERKATVFSGALIKIDGKSVLLYRTFGSRTVSQTYHPFRYVEFGHLLRRLWTPAPCDRSVYSVAGVTMLADAVQILLPSKVDDKSVKPVL